MHCFRCLDSVTTSPFVRRDCLNGGRDRWLYSIHCLAKAGQEAMLRSNLLHTKVRMSPWCSSDKVSYQLEHYHHRLTSIFMHGLDANTRHEIPPPDLVSCVWIWSNFLWLDALFSDATLTYSTMHRVWTMSSRFCNCFRLSDICTWLCKIFLVTCFWFVFMIITFCECRNSHLRTF